MDTASNASDDETNWPLYRKVAIIVTIWMGIGTIFYSFHNDWPLSQAFFYAVDAGMSIGFCTEGAPSSAFCIPLDT